MKHGKFIRAIPFQANCGILYYIQTSKVVSKYSLEYYSYHFKLILCYSIFSVLRTVHPCISLPQFHPPCAFYVSRKRYLMVQQNIPLPPKRPATPYILYLSERVKSFKKDGRNGADLSRAISKEWNAMDDTERSIYREQHSDLMVSELW